MIAEGLLERSLRSLRVGPLRSRSPDYRSRTAGRRVGTAGRRGPRTLVLVVALGLSVAVLTGAYLWLRTSSLVAVDRVAVTGVSGPQESQIRAALTAAAHGMTTLAVRTNTLRAAVTPYPLVKSLTVSPQFPHELRIDVTEQVPVASISIGGETVSLAADGTLLRDVPGTQHLPSITLKDVPGGSRVDEPAASQQLTVLGAAPYAFLAKVASLTTDYWHGVVAQLRSGPAIYFGDATRAAAKWRAVIALLATSQTAGASYIDVSDPNRPAAGTTAAAAVTLTSGAGSSPAASGTSAAVTPATQSATAGSGAPGSAATGTAGSGAPGSAATGTAVTGAGSGTPSTGAASGTGNPATSSGAVATGASTAASPATTGTGAAP